MMYRMTTDAHPKIAAVHDRMPVVLRREHYDLWLDPEVRDRELLVPLLTAEAGQWLDMHPVSHRVNSPAHEGPELVEPV